MRWAITVKKKTVLRGNLVLPHRIILDGELVIIDDIIVEVNEHASSRSLEETVTEGYLVPGLIDLHIHGIAGHDVMDARRESYQAMDAHLAKVGCTRYLATTMSAGQSELERVFRVLDQYLESSMDSGVMGIHMEGPYIHPQKIGAQRPDAVRIPSLSEIEGLMAIRADLLKRVTLAPELPGALDFISFCLDHGIAPSLGHSRATFEEAEQAFSLGVSQVTHLFNAMTGLNHRAPGLAGAALLSPEVLVELIVDGVHLHRDVVRLVEKLKGSQKVLLVTDAMRAALLKDGIYELGGQSMQVEGGVARTAEGQLAGSTLTLLDAVWRYHDYTQVPLYEAVAAASLVPARAMQWSRHGALLPGYVADVLFVDHTGQNRATYRRGELIYDGR